MKPYQIISDSSCDLPTNLLETLNIGIVPYYVSFDTVSYYKEILELTPETFYDEVKARKVYPKTSLPPIQDYINIFEPYLKEGKDILCICLTSKFSGSYQSAINAGNILLETYPDARIEVMDSISVTGTQGLLVYEACRMRDEGYSLDRLVETLDRQKQTSKINFTVDSLDFLQKGGRVGKASALAGTILNIKPIIIMTDGELFPSGKVRGHKKALRHIIEMTKEEIGAEKEKYRICVIRAERERQAAAEEVSDELRGEGFDVTDEIWPIGITIGTHAGPTPIGICYIKKYEYL
ncbi:MAG: DegV family protein [Anaerotignum sp.]|jgi:DegV family protein with EDD domain|nr:DegV family protein [Anaerotignum sp.]